MKVGLGCNNCQRLPFRSDTHHSLLAEKPHSDTTRRASQTRWVIAWSVEGDGRECGSLSAQGGLAHCHFQPSRM